MQAEESNAGKTNASQQYTGMLQHRGKHELRANATCRKTDNGSHVRELGWLKFEWGIRVLCNPNPRVG